jgi:protocatechuate 3,4-dioxygenase beta subunit
MNRISTLALVAAFITLSGGRTRAQGMIRGQVHDGAGAPLAGAVVTATGPQGPFAAVTNRDGYYLIDGLTGGDYDIRTRMPGYPSTLILQVRILGSRPLELDCQLSPEQELYRVHTSPIEPRTTYPVVRIVFDEPPVAGS